MFRYPTKTIMMKRIFLFTISLLLGTLLFGQIAYSPLVDSLKNEITEASVTGLLEELSGEVPVMIGGDEHTLVTRHSYSPFNALAAQWIYEQFEAMGIPVEYHYFGDNGENVVATITGSLYPDQQYIICAHYDDMPSGNLAPGADDNASGVVGVIETARLLKDQDLKYTVKFIAFDEEEQGLIGSTAYAGQAATAGDDILGVLNLDMIAYDSNDDYEMSIATNAQSAGFTAEYTSVLGIYDFDLGYNFISTSASDHSPFWNNGYQAILTIEDWYDFNAFYHTVNDLLSNCNIPYFRQMTQAAFATIASLGMDMKMELYHEPLASGNDTTEREAILIISSNHPVGTGPGAPRLYYSVDESLFIPLEPSYSNQDTFWFMIPGQSMGSKIDYYLAAQDEAGSMIATLPGGGRGVNPPGSIAPGFFYTYLIADIQSLYLCSNTLPKEIKDLHNTFDTIMVEQEGMLTDLNVNLDITHTYTGDVEIYLIGPSGQEIDLCVAHGGSGNNFTGTVFDDQALIPIAQGTPPFTGSFIPDEPLGTFNGEDIAGMWILRVYDNALNDQGILQNWCISMQYSGEPVSIASHDERNTLLQQNYPNPFSGRTVIPFELDRGTHVVIRVYDMMGREAGILADRYYDAGAHKISMQAGKLTAGKYIYKMQTDHSVEVRSMMIVK